MGRDPAVLFYTSDFLTGTMTWDNEQVGMFIRLLCLQHQKGRLSEKDMLKICSTRDDEVFGKFAQDPDGFYINKRMEDETLRRQRYSESRSNNRKKKLKPSKKTSKTYDKHMETETETETENRTITETEKVIMPFDSPTFLKMWGYWKEYKKTEFRFSYKSPVSEQAAAKQLATLSNGDEGTALQIIERSMANGWKGFFPPDKKASSDSEMVEYKKELKERAGL